MSRLLEKALERVGSLPEDEQDGSGMSSVGWLVKP